jgi:hypothetical protein
MRMPSGLVHMDPLDTCDAASFLDKDTPGAGPGGDTSPVAAAAAGTHEPIRILSGNPSVQQWKGQVSGFPQFCFI